VAAEVAATQNHGGRRSPYYRCVDRPMKNIQVIDGADNCVYDIFMAHCCASD